MPRKERLRKKKEGELQQAAQSSSSLLSWIRPASSSRADESTGKDYSDLERDVLSPDKEPTDDAEDIPGATAAGSSPGAATEKGLCETAGQEEDAMEIGATAADRAQEEATEGSQVEESAANKGDEALSNLAALQYPTDPAHIQKYNIKCSDSYIAMCCNVGPCQPDITYPKNTEGRSFQKRWYSNNPWLEYSAANDAMYCFSCRLFLSEEKFKSKTAWKMVGISRWKHAIEKISEHSGSETHMTSMVRWNTYKKKTLKAAFDVSDTKGKEERERDRLRNREILNRLIDITMHLARQGQAFRGDDETTSSENQGNFLELVKLFAQYDSVMNLHLDAVSKMKTSKKRPQVSLLSNRTQNDIITALGTYFRREIQKEIKDAEIYSILLDETTDVSHKEQVSFVVRYVHEMEIKERFIQVCNVDTTTGQELENVVLSLLQENGLEMKNMRGQGYDGAANMSGMYRGLQARIRTHNEKALYVHCKAHCLNLVLVESAKSSVHFVTFFNLVEKLYVFCTSSTKKHTAFLKCQQSVYPGQRVVELQKLSDTRWACRERALKALQKVLKAVLKLLTDISESDPPDLATGDAQMYLDAINFEFLLCLEITTPVFQITALASDALQQKDLDHSTAYKVIDGVLDTLKTNRSEEEFKTIFENASQKAESLDIPIPTVVPGQGRKRKVPAHFQHSTTAAKVSHQFKSVEEYYRIKVYYTFLDTMTQELHRRFKGDDDRMPTDRIIQSFHSLTVPANWVSSTNPEADQAIHTLFDLYGVEEEKLKLELKVFHASFPIPSNDSMKVMLATLKENRGQLIFPTLVQMIKTYATLPVSTATVERSFSKLKIIKNKLRSLCREDRLSDLLLLAIERDIQVSRSEVIRIFKDMAPRRMLL